MWAAFNNFLASIMAGIYSWCQSYGWSAAIFTLFVSLVRLPFEIKQKQSMRRMQEVNPKLQALQKKYANDKQKLQQKQAELYKKEKINPLSSCLPMLLSMPLLFAMFAVMRNMANEQLMRMMVQIHEAVGPAIEREEVYSALDALMAGGFHFEKFLWIKNLWMADSPFATVLPINASGLAALRAIEGVLTAEGLAELKTFMNSTAYAHVLTYFRATPSSYNLNLIITQLHFYNTPNGYFVLPIIAALSQLLSTMLQPMDANAGMQAEGQKGTGNFMKYFFPLFSLYICATSNAAFAIYWVVANFATIVSQLSMNWYFKRKDTIDAQKLKGDTRQ